VKNTFRVVALLLIGIIALFVSVGLFAEEKAPQDVYILKGAPMGGVKFNHKVHATSAKCDTCHHASKAEKPLTSEHQACTDCHTQTATAPMKTKAQAAFHNATATSGVCIDCHKKVNAEGKKAPTKCNECHQKQNA